MSAGAHTEFVGTDWMSCRCILGADHTREQYDAFYEEEDDDRSAFGGSGTNDK